MTGVDRKTIRRYDRDRGQPGGNSPGVATGSGPEKSAIDGAENPPAWPPVQVQPPARSACEIHREWIETQVQLGRNAVSIYQDLVEQKGFTHRYNSVKRFVRELRAREPERFDVLDDYPAGEEAQVHFSQGASTRTENGKCKKPWLFVLTLKYSGKSFRKVVWKTDQQTCAEFIPQDYRVLHCFR